MTGALGSSQSGNLAAGERETEAPIGKALSPLGRAALAYARIGWPVFPCREREKAPKIAKAHGGNGCHDATTDAATIRAWWTRWPNANPGVATGGPLGLLVVDVDGPEGEHALQAFGPLPVTVEVKTGKGRHLYFHAPPAAARCTTRELGPMLDTRGSGGYVLAPPSVHPDGLVYTFVEGRGPHDVEVAPLPAALVERLSRPATVPSIPRAGRPARARARTTVERADVLQFRAWLAKVPTGLRDGDGRKATAYRIAARGLETLGEAHVRAVLAAWNRGNAEPLSDTDLYRKLTAALTRSQRRAA